MSDPREHPDANRPENGPNEPNDKIKTQKQTNFLNLPDAAATEDMPQRRPQPDTARLTSGWRLLFTIGDERVQISVQDHITVGRKTSPSDAIDFDLTPQGAYHYGVSRHHARFYLQDGYLYLEDLGSTNGTRINGFHLTPAQRYRLRDSDEVEFARLRMEIRFVKPTQRL